MLLQFPDIFVDLYVFVTFRNSKSLMKPVLSSLESSQKVYLQHSVRNIHIPRKKNSSLIVLFVYT